MAITRKRIDHIREIRDRLHKAVADLEWAYRGLHYTSDDAPAFDPARRRAEQAAQALLDLLPTLDKDVKEGVG